RTKRSNLRFGENQGRVRSLPFLFLRMSRLGLKIGVCAGVVAAATAFAQMPTVELSAGIHLIRAEVAYTFETRAQGLMFRKALGPNEGMFFVFPRAEIYCMWMKNTLIPLSVAFLDE